MTPTTSSTIRHCFISQPEKSEWKCYLFGHPNGIVFHPNKVAEPNWFWRKMQYLILGHKWVKTK